MSITLTPVQEEPSLDVEHRRIGGAKWRLWIPEVFIAETDSDRFLKCAGPDAQNYPISVEWEEANRCFSYTWTNEGVGGIPLEYRVSASAGDDLVDLQFKVKNVGQTRWPKQFSAAVCLSNKEAPSFVDPDGKRTTLFTESGPETVWNLVEDLHSRSVIKWLGMDFYVGARSDPSSRHWNVKHGLVVRESVEGGWKMAFGWDTVARVDVVLGSDSMSCIHSHPEFEKLSAGESLTRYGRVWFSQARLDEILQRYMAFAAEKGRAK